MNQLDLYYRAFKEFRKETAEDAACERARKAIAKSNCDADKLEATKYLCDIREDWVKAIEEGLTYVEKAVAEERQFIRTDGEVVPIEKVKKVAKDSVVHLAKHSDLITHIPEDESEDVIPDKLYMVEKLSDYAVYENRFLYMLLCYLNDFINFRLEKIEALRHTYSGNFAVDKEITSKSRKLVIRAQVEENRTDNPYPVVDERSAGLIQRIKDCQSIVTSLLGTDLMVQVAKTPMIKPPITKTNVLKMNNNFKRALALYDYVATYKDLGYTYEEVHTDYTPFADKVADEIAESANLIAFLSYKYGNGIDELLDGAYKIEEQRRKEEEERKKLEKIKRLQKRALESNKTMEEYMLLLEERNRALEKDSAELQVIRLEVENLNRRIDVFNMERVELNRRMSELQTEIEAKEQEIVRLNQKYIEDMETARREHEAQTVALEREHAAETEAMQAEHDREVAQLNIDFAAKLRETTATYEERADALKAELAEVRAHWEEVRQGLESGLAEVEARAAGFDAEQKKLADKYEAQMRNVQNDCRRELDGKDKESAAAIEEWEKENHMIRAELDAMRIQHGLMKPSEDYTSRERFVELESEFEAFKLFFKGQWKLTKKAIRREVYAEQKAGSSSPPPPADTSGSDAQDNDL